MKKFQTFVETYRVKDKKNKFNFTSVDNPKGCFNIPEDKLTKFYELYEAATKKNHLNFLETPSPIFSGIAIDVDLKSKNTSKTRLYKSGTIKKIIKFYRKELVSLVELKEKSYAFVYEKEKGTAKENKEVKDGFHIVFPDIVTNYPIQHYLRAKLIENFDEIFEGATFDNTPQDIVDSAIINRNNWCLHKSSTKKIKQENLHSLYNVTKIYEISNKSKSLKEIEPESFEVPDNQTFTEYLRIFNKQINTKLKNDDDIEKINLYLPNQVVEEEKGVIQTNSEGIDKLNFEMTQKLVSILNPKRSDNYEDWINLGWCLHNISPKREFLDIWIDFSRKSAQYKDSTECTRIWNKSSRNSNRKLTIASLHYWAKNDNPEEYEKITKNSIQTKLDRPQNTHFDVASVIYELYKFDFIYIHSTSDLIKGWYQYQNHKWEHQPDGYSLRVQLSKSIHDMYLKLSKDFTNQAIKYNNDDENESKSALFKDKSKIAHKISKDLKNRTYKASIMSECADLFRDPHFEKNLNKSPYLISCTNGVYDLKSHIFREGIPDDYISMSSNTEYIPLDKIPQKTIDKINKFMEDIQPDKSTRDYLWKILATCLEQINREEKFYIFTGKGRNGKSKLVDLINSTIGEYTCTIPITVITRKRGDASRPTPEIVKLKNKRLSILKEPDSGMSDNILNMGMIKELTGNDYISARNLHENDNEFQVSATMILMCNILPDVSSTDDGTWDRLRVVDFPTHFTPNPKKPNEKLIDKKLGEEIKNWKSAFLTLLIEHYKKYEKEGMNEPNAVLNETAKYRERNDIFREFINKNFMEFKPTKLNPTTAPISLTEIYNTFKAWYADSYPGRKLIVKKEIEHFFRQHFGQNFDGKRLQNYKLIYDDEE